MSAPLESAASLTGVSETLLITLYARALETQRPDPILFDPKAVEIVARLNYDFAKFDQAWASQLGTVLRSRAFDRLTQAFIAQHPDAVVVSLGCGFCSRFLRVDNGTIHWYDVDFPRVIELRRRLFSPHERDSLIAASLFDWRWIETIQRHPNQPLLLLLEGVCMYLTEAEMRVFLQAVQRRLAPVELICDVFHPASARTTKQHDSVSKTTAQFKWGIAHAKELEQWQVGVTVLAEHDFLLQFAHYPQRLPKWVRLWRWLIPVAKKACYIIQMQIDPATLRGIPPATKAL